MGIPIDVVKGAIGAAKAAIPKAIEEAGAVKGAVEVAVDSSPRARVQALSRGAEVRAKGSLDMKSRVQNLARQQELGAKASVANSKQAVSGKSVHESAAFKAARGRAFAKRQAILKNKANAAANASSVTPKKTPTGLAAIPKGEVPGTGRGYTDVAGKGPKAPVLGKGGRNQVSPAGQSAYEKATGKSMFGPNGEGMPARQRAMWVRKNQGK